MGGFQGAVPSHPVNSAVGCFTFKSHLVSYLQKNKSSMRPSLKPLKSTNSYMSQRRMRSMCVRRVNQQISLRGKARRRKTGWIKKDKHLGICWHASPCNPHSPPRRRGTTPPLVSDSHSLFCLSCIPPSSHWLQGCLSPHCLELGWETPPPLAHTAGSCHKSHSFWGYCADTSPWAPGLPKPR